MNHTVRGRSGKIFQIITDIILIILALCALLPFILLLSSSLSDESLLFTKGYGFIPKGFTLAAYEFLFSNNFRIIMRTLGNSFFITVVGLGLHLAIAPMFAFVLSRKNNRNARFYNKMLIFTMMFNGGMVGQYMMWTNVFGIKDTIWALIFPNLVFTAYYVVLYRNSFSTGIHESLLESARIDGANDFKIYVSIVLPLSKPILASVGLMTGIRYWNDWVNGMYYISDQKLYSLQVFLTKIVQSIQLIIASGDSNLDTSDLPSISVRMAIAVIGTIPIMVLYPFFQKAFVSGITLGGVKE